MNKRENFQVGDMLKYYLGEDICVVTERLTKADDTTYKVFWLFEKGYTRNTLSSQIWSDTQLHRDFTKLS